MGKRTEIEIKLEISVEEFAYNFKKEIKNPWSTAKNGWEDNFYGRCRKNKFYFLFQPACIRNNFLPVLKGKIERKGEEYYITYRIAHKLFYKPKKTDERLRKELMKLCNQDKTES